MKVTKVEINKVLKELGNGFVKMSDGEGWSEKTVCYTDWNNKRVKGIRVSSRGPMDVTDAWSEARDRNVSRIKDELKDLGLRETSSSVFETADGKIKLSLNVEEYPQYTRSTNLDSGYVNLYLVPRYILPRYI